MPIVEEVPYRTETIVVLDVQTQTGMYPITLVAGDRYVLTTDELVITYKDRPDKSLRFERRNLQWWAVATETRKVPLTQAQSIPLSDTTSLGDPSSPMPSASASRRARARRTR